MALVDTVTPADGGLASLLDDASPRLAASTGPIPPNEKKARSRYPPNHFNTIPFRNATTVS